jgi:hypothetical protein
VVVSDRSRHDLFVALRELLGAGPADTLMALLPPVGWADVARRSDVDALRAELKGEVAELRGEMSELRGEMALLRADLSGRIDTLVPKLVMANLGTTLAVGALAVGLASAV